MSTLLFSGGLNPSPDSSWVDDLIQYETPEIISFYDWVKSNSYRFLSPQNRDIIERVDRYCLATMIKHTGITSECQEFSENLLAERTLNNETQNKVILLIKKSWALCSNIIKQGQTLKQWNYCVEEKEIDSTIIPTHKQSLSELCSLKQVQFDENEIEVTRDKLTEKF